MTPLAAQNCAVVLVNYNNAADTLACLAALERLHTLPAHVVVVDNASHPQDVTHLHRGWEALCTEAGVARPAAAGGLALPPSPAYFAATVLQPGLFRRQ